MKIIICGAGEVGFSLAKYLSSENMQVTVIDEDTEKLHKMTIVDSGGRSRMLPGAPGAPLHDFCRFGP